MYRFSLPAGRHARQRMALTAMGSHQAGAWPRQGCQRGSQHSFIHNSPLWASETENARLFLNKSLVPYQA